MTQSVTNGEPTISDVLDAVNKFANNVEQRFNGVESDIKDMKRTLTTLVTRDYLDEKLGDLRGDMVVLMRKEDSKLRQLVNILHEKNLLDDQDVKRLVTMDPFVQLVV